MDFLYFSMISIVWSGIEERKEEDFINPYSVLLIILIGYHKYEKAVCSEHYFIIHKR